MPCPPRRSKPAVAHRFNSGMNVQRSSLVEGREQRLGHGSLLPRSICEHVDSEL